MVYCCVPQCGTDSWRCDPSITFHDFPSSPDLAAKWIQQINNAVKSENMWFPGANSVVCSKHFLSTDFKDDSDALKPRVVPTVFGHKYIGHNADVEETTTVNKSNSSGPVIVKIKTEDGGKQDVLIPDVHLTNSLLNALINEPENIDAIINEPENIETRINVPKSVESIILQSPATASNISRTHNTYLKKISMGVQQQASQPIFQEYPPDLFQPFKGRNKDKNINLHKVAQNIMQTTPKLISKTSSLTETIKKLVQTTPKLITNTSSSTDTVKILMQTTPKLMTNTNSSTDTVKKVIQTTPKLMTNTSSSTETVSKNTKSSKETNNTELNKVSEKSKAIKKPAKKRDTNDNNLIEIGPNTFLKINPDIIKVNKKLTPSGNTVLQFLMDQNLASSIGTDVLPKIVQGAISNIGEATESLKRNKSNSVSKASTGEAPSTETADPPKTDTVVQHVVGHLVDTHVCKDSCANLQEVNDNLMETDNIDQDGSMDDLMDNIPDRNSSPTFGEKSNKVIVKKTPNLNKQSEVFDDNADSCIAKAPILLTTNMPLAHCFMEKTKYLTNLRQKARQIATLKHKVSTLDKKIEELEDRCVVQERQLSFSFLKKLRTIRKNASKGDPPATYILEQIRAYTGQKQMRWSDSTLQQCAVWCKKAPYAYEYFKKADFFKLPCLGTVKRFMKKHPEMPFSNKTSSNNANDDGESSSDFNFDEEDSMGELDKEMKELQNEEVVCESVISEESKASSKTDQTSYQVSNLINSVDEQSSMVNTVEVIYQNNDNSENNTLQNVKTDNVSETKTFPVNVDGTSLEVQELILPSGEVVQCYSSNICNSGEPNNQYYIIPSTGDTGTGVEHEYSIVQSADSVPVILQNLENSNLQQEQLIFITNSSDQVECTETEVMTAR